MGRKRHAIPQGQSAVPDTHDAPRHPDYRSREDENDRSVGVRSDARSRHARVHEQPRTAYSTVHRSRNRTVEADRARPEGRVMRARGFSLLEVIVALTIAVMVFTVAFRGVSVSFDTLRRVEQSDRRLELVRSKLAEIDLAGPIR